jgi:hypothetical protein
VAFVVFGEFSNNFQTVVTGGENLRPPAADSYFSNDFRCFLTAFLFAFLKGKNFIPCLLLKAVVKMAFCTDMNHSKSTVLCKHSA